MRYSKDGKKDDFDENKELNEDSKKYSLSYLLSECADFKNEISDIEHLARDISNDLQINVNILFTPKFHCELAGKGIEYSWGAAKRLYRRHPLHKN